eukprot:scaffold23428_cov86-Isochrysis_galbana.AAC.1
MRPAAASACRGWRAPGKRQPAKTVYPRRERARATARPKPESHLHESQQSAFVLMSARLETAIFGGLDQLVGFAPKPKFRHLGVPP